MHLAAWGYDFVAWVAQAIVAYVLSGGVCAGHDKPADFL